MLHKSRVWVVHPVSAAEELAEKLTQHTWTCCQAFSLAGYLFVSDATSGDGAQEYGILRREGDDYVQIESITFSWCTQAKALEYIQKALQGEYDQEVYARVSGVRLQTPEKHQRCFHCA